MKEGRSENIGSVLRNNNNNNNNKRRLYLYHLLPTKQHNIPEDMDLQQHGCDNPVSHKCTSVIFT